jgi:hypothetical protein
MLGPETPWLPIGLCNVKPWQALRGTYGRDLARGCPLGCPRGIALLKACQAPFWAIGRTVNTQPAISGTIHLQSSRIDAVVRLTSARLLDHLGANSPFSLCQSEALGRC